MNKRKIWTVANIISAVRIGAAPIILLILYLDKWINGSLHHSLTADLKYPWITFVAVVIYVLAAVSDAFDGYMARKRDEVTNLGKFLDPLADKIVVSTVLIMLVYLGWAPAWIAILIIMREITITALRSMASAEGVIIAAGPWGKAKTITQNIALPFLILNYDHFGIPIFYIGTVMLYVALVLTIYSGWDYLNKFFTDRQSE